MTDLPDDVICNIAIYANDTIFYSKCEWACDLWQQLDVASELEFDLQDAIDWGRKCAFDFNARKLKLFCLTGLMTMVILPA